MDENQIEQTSLMNSPSFPVALLTKSLLNTEMYHRLQDELDKEGSINYSNFNDLEMMYLFVHKRKHLKQEDERMENTKKEMIRDLLIFYKHLLTHHHEFEVPLLQLDVATLLKNLTERNIRKYEEWLVQAPFGKGRQPYAKATLARKSVIVKGFFSFLYKSNYIKFPLHEKMRSSQVTERDRPNRDVSTLEMELILQHYKDHPIIHPLLLVLATTGLRIKELCTAKVCDLTLEKGEFWLQVEGKGRKKRETLIHPPVYEAICRFRKRRRLHARIDPTDNSPLFVTSTNKAYTYKYLSNYLTKRMNDVPADIVQSRDKPITPHHLRHFWAGESADLGVDLLRIQKALGHSSARTTEIYLKKSIDRKNHAAHAWGNSSILNT